MAFFDRMKDSLTTAGQEVSQKAKNATENVRLGNLIKNNDKMVDKLLYQVGLKYYEAHGQEEGTEYQELFAEINRLKSENAAYQQELDNLAATNKCPQCGFGNNAGAKFCISCGAPLNQTPVAPAATVMASDATETVQEIITDNEIDSLVSDPDKVVDIIMYAKDKVAEQDISDEQIREIIQAGEETAGVTLTEEEENKLINIVKEIKNADINEEQLRSTINKVYDKLEEMGIGKKEVKGILQKLIEFAKNILE